MATSILLADTVTRLSVEHAGCVLVTGSHGGVIAAWYAARAGVRAAIFNDAGIGRDEAGIAGLAWLERFGVAAACVGHRSARIADASDALAHGTISSANGPARACGVVPGQRCAEAARRLAAAPAIHVRVPAFADHEGRTVLQPRTELACAVLGLDSIGLVTAADASAVLVIGSHGGLHGGDPASALPVEARAAFFHDAGIGRDEAGTTRLPVLAQRGIPAATVDYRSARIGDACSMWATGVLSRVNDAMATTGVTVGGNVREAALRLALRGA